MNKPVYYLCYKTTLNGFLFPDELPKDYYSPGLFILETDNNNNLSYHYDFKAMQQGREITLKLFRSESSTSGSNLYIVKTADYGIFGFTVEQINPKIKYLGKKQKLANHKPLYIAISIDQKKLEQVCHEHDFYFIGDVLREQKL